MSIQPKYDQASAKKNRPQIVSSRARAIGDGGVTRISSDAGRNSRSVAVSCTDFGAGGAAFATGTTACGAGGAGLVWFVAFTRLIAFNRCF